MLLLAPAAALLAALFAGEPLLAHWTQTFMGGTAQFLAQFFPARSDLIPKTKPVDGEGMFRGYAAAGD